MQRISTIKTRIFLTIPLLSLLLIISQIANAALKNGFDLSNSVIPVQEILAGGPPRDGIPAIDQPHFIPANKNITLTATDRILGITINGVSKAYPIAILNWHEIVNDRIDNKPIVISYCPLCGSGVAFSAATKNTQYSFGVSGLLYNSDVLLYDRKTKSLWSQLLGKAISGPLQGTTLQQLPLTHTSWLDWYTRHPDSLVLTQKTGYQRDYKRDPYAGYSNRSSLIFPVNHEDSRYHAKEQVLGIIINGQAKAWPFSELAQTSGNIKEDLGGEKIKITYDDEHHSAAVFDSSGNRLNDTTTFWFAWFAFHPDTEVFIANNIK